MQAKSRRLSTFGSMPEVPSEYKSIYAYFVVQYHQLEDYLKSIIRLHSQKPENKCISLMESHLKSILSSQYGSLLVVCKNAILDLNNILSNEKDAAINSLAQDILFVCLSIFQLSPSPTSRGVNIEFNHVRKPSQNNTHNTQSGTQNNHNASSHNLNHIQYASSNPSLSQGEIAKHFPQILQQKHGRKINPNRSLNLNQDFGPNVHHHQNVISIGSNNQKSSFAPKAMIESKSKHSPINTSTSFDSYMATNNEANVSPSSYPKISSEFNMSPNHSYNSNLDSVGNHSYSSNGELLMSDSQLDHSDGQLDHRDSQLNDSLTSHGSTKIMNGNSFPSLASPQSLPPRANPSGYSRRKSTGSIIRLESLRSRSSSLLLETKFPDSELTDNSDNDKNYVLCRICDEKVPLDLIEEHTDSCLNAYQNASIGTNVDIQLKKCISDCQTEHMNVKWPGQQRIATMTLIPMLKLIVLMNQAIQIDLNFSDSQEVLSQIISEINVLKADNNNPTVTSILKEIRPLLKQKLRASKAILNAEVILSQTRKSGDGHKKFQTQAQISDFDFVKRISRGAYARVFLARKKNSGDIFAIKVIPKSSLQNKNQVKRVLDEKNILLQFSNPYIVNFYYSIIGNNNLYLVMEFLPGGDLYSLLQKLGSIDEDATKYYLLQLLNALKYLHSNGIIHRDLKPDNILISEDGTLKLTDFGLSYMGMIDRQKTNDISLIKAKSLVGTPDYIAPEIIINSSHTFTADYWSLGVILYEFLLGEPPFHGEDENQTYKNILSCRYVIDENDGLSPEATDLIRKLLILNPEERLGAKSIDDIFNHPFFKGVDLNGEPPFRPELKNDEDTEYFETRYQFCEKDEADIVSDIHESGGSCSSSEPIPSLSPSTNMSNIPSMTNMTGIPSMDNSSNVISNFQSVSVNSLAVATRKDAEKRRRSMSFASSPDRPPPSILNLNSTSPDHTLQADQPNPLARPNNPSSIPINVGGNPLNVPLNAPIPNSYDGKPFYYNTVNNKIVGSNGNNFATNNSINGYSYMNSNDSTSRNDNNMNNSMIVSYRNPNNTQINSYNFNGQTPVPQMMPNHGQSAICASQPNKNAPLVLPFQRQYHIPQRRVEGGLPLMPNKVCPSMNEMRRRSYNQKLSPCNSSPAAVKYAFAGPNP